LCATVTESCRCLCAFRAPLHIYQPVATNGTFASSAAKKAASLERHYNIEFYHLRFMFG
jgi:hypothetical protein